MNDQTKIKRPVTSMVTGLFLDPSESSHRLIYAISKLLIVKFNLIII